MSETPDDSTGALAAIAVEMERALQRHVKEAWFPRCIDGKRGGYVQGFDRRWGSTGDGSRILEFQARQTRVAARLALAYPREGQWAEYALHGFRFLRDVMWDAEGDGGWYWLLRPDGSADAGETKHSHSGSYAVQACSLVYEATGDASALEMAMQGFDWFEQHALDREFGGYHGWMRRDGSVIRSGSELPEGAGPLDPMDHEVGLKDVNVQGDWFEALMDLRKVSDDRRVAERLESLGAIYLEHLSTAAGEVRFLFAPDWTPEPGPEQFGYCFQAAHRMLDAEAVFPERGFGKRAAKITAHGATAGRRKGGGFAFQAEDGARRVPDLSRYGERRRAWWVQFEALRAFAHFAVNRGPKQDAYQRLLQRHWRFVKRELLDERYGGVYGTVASDLMPWDRPGFPRAGRYLHKGGPMKDASHECDSLLGAIGVLRGGGDS